MTTTKYLFPLALFFILFNGLEAYIEPISYNMTASDVFSSIYAHDSVRWAVEPKPSSPLSTVSWFAPLAHAAESLADKCDASKIQPKLYSFGVNVNALIFDSFEEASKVWWWMEAIKSWSDERLNYDWSTGECVADKQCRNYLQLVVKSKVTVQIGCARRFCPIEVDGSKKILDLSVCAYSPRVDVSARPYVASN